MSAPTANWSYPTAVRFGPGRIKELADACRAAGISRPLLVTDAGLAKLAITENALGLLKAAGLPVAMFSDVQPNPVDANVDAGVAVFRSGGHDGVVAFGGGSGLDTGKVIAFMAGQTRPMWDFEDIGDWWTRANPDGIAPIVAVPTTAGTGSEVGRAGVITNEATHTKKVIFHPKMMPKVVICDPELTIGLPPKVTAGTGMDALAHCLEAYCAPGFHPLADGIGALAEPTPSRIRGLVTRIIDERVQQGQLDECGLTLQELAKIRDAFIPVLTAIFHVRAPYPEDPRRRRTADADLRRDAH